MNTLRCLCGRSFPQDSAFTNHNRTCPQSRKRRGTALDLAKENWMRRKRRRIDHSADSNAHVAASSSGVTSGPLISAGLVVSPEILAEEPTPLLHNVCLLNLHFQNLLKLMHL